MRTTLGQRLSFELFKRLCNDLIRNISKDEGVKILDLCMAA